ncbi:MAG: gliding motility-associated C-terminal domain-containing protein [Bacteroidetes bacterium]|nr:gliding motility-associated C-terminal domain-containing protein [Bacteroidota bacterium]
MIFFSTHFVIAGRNANAKFGDKHPKLSKYIASEKGQSSLSQNLRGSGMCFTENKGQIADMNGKLCSDILYRSESAGADIYIRKTGMSYVLNNSAELLHRLEEQEAEFEREGKVNSENVKEKREELKSRQMLKLHRVDVDFVNCNLNSNIEVDDRVEGYSNYYYSHCPKGITHLNSYNKVTVKNIYDNIDVKYYACTERSRSGGKVQGLKYDIVVNPGADPNQIKLRWTGVENLHINSGGHLVIKTSINEFFESMPKVYQVINGKIVDVRARYILNGITVNFELGTWNPELPLVIDPWATYYGGGSSDYCYSLSADNSGNVVFVGQTSSINFPVSIGAFQTINNGNSDAFIVKMDVGGNRLWATYFGGTAAETGYDVSVDPTGNILAVGSTASGDLPVGAAPTNTVYQNTSGGGTDAFVLKSDAAGILQWSSYYGDTGTDAGFSVCSDGSNIYVYGETNSTGAISSTGAYQTALKGSVDLFLVSFKFDGSRNWATYLGGASKENAGGITWDFASGNLYLTGITDSSDLPVSAGAYQTLYGGVSDAFVFKFDQSGALQWGSYFGGSSSEKSLWGTYPETVCDGLGNVIIAGGGTGSTANIATAGAYQTLFGGGEDGYIAKFNTNGVIQWATYLGGNMNESIVDIAVDVYDNIYVFGTWEDTDAGNYPISQCAYQTQFGGVEDQFVAKYNSNGIQTCMTYLGGTGHDEIDTYSRSGGMALSGSTVYCGGMTDGGYPITTGAFQTTANSTLTIFITQLNSNICSPNLKFIADKSEVCPNTSIAFTSSMDSSCDTTGLKFAWSFPGATPSASSLPNPSAVYISPGFYSVKLVYTNNGQIDSVDKVNSVFVKPCNSTITVAATGATACPGHCNTISALGSGGTGPYTYSWNTGDTAQAINVCPTANATYTVLVKDAVGGIGYDTVSVNLIQNINVQVSIDTISCAGNNATAMVIANDGTSPYVYSWSSGQISQTSSGLGTGTYTITVTDAIGCAGTGTLQVQAMAINLSVVSIPSCYADSNGAITGSVSGGSGSFSYSWSNGATGSTTISGLSAGTYSVVVTDAAGCVAVSTVTITQPSAISNPVFTKTNETCGAGNGSVVVTSGGGTGILNYSWSNGVSGSTVSGLSAGSYTVTLADANSCSKTASVTISNVAGPSIDFVSAIHVLCSGGSGQAVASASGGSGALIYSWSTGTTGQIANNLSAGTYSVTVTDVNACTAISTVSITSPPVMVVSASQTTPEKCSKSNGVATSTVSGGIGSFTFSWSNGQTTNTATALSANTYTVTITDNNGCSKTAFTTIDSIGAPVFSSAFTNATCGQNIGTASVAASGGTVPFSYTWAPGGGTGSYITNLSAGIYTVTVMDANSCSRSAVLNVGNSPVAVADFTTIPLKGVVPAKIDFVNTSSGTTAWLWNYGDGQTDSIQNPNHTYTGEGTYKVCLIAKSSAVCIDSICRDIVVFGKPVIVIPNVFSPNSDGRNDNFDITTVGISKIEITIWDRWGLIMWDNEGVPVNWDGRTMAGKEVPDGTYYYLVKAYGYDNKVYGYKGFLTLVR